jgi:Holliday junction resolvase RusA-like endonuclease
VTVFVDYRGPVVSTNAAYRRRGGPRLGLYLTPEGAAFKQGLSLAAKRAMRDRIRFQGPVSVLVDFWFKTASNDVDGPLKLVLDALQGHVYANDRQVVHVSAGKHKADDPKSVGLSLTVKAVENEDTP